jgi:putative membrane protein
MIRNFTDQAANERTFLAWLRTGMAVIAFGFVVEKFNLFILAFGGASSDVTRRIRAERLDDPLARYDGMALILVGAFLIIVGTLRFVRNNRLIGDIQVHEPGGVRMEILTATLLVLIVAAYCISVLLG